MKTALLISKGSMSDTSLIKWEGRTNLTCPPIDFILIGTSEGKTIAHTSMSVFRVFSSGGVIACANVFVSMVNED